MKKWIALMITVTMIFMLVSCAASTGDTSAVEEASAQDKTQNTDADAAEASSEQPEEGRAIVVYFSRTGEQYGVGVIEKGNTAIVADMIAEQTGADSFEILPKDDCYPVTYKELTDYAKEEQNNNVRPELASSIEDFSVYDTVYLG